MNITGKEGVGAYINLAHYSILEQYEIKGMLLKLLLVDNTTDTKIFVISFYINPREKEDNKITLNEIENTMKGNID
jgi:hypothetical protein